MVQHNAIAGGLLGRHVAERAQEVARHGEVSARLRHGQAKSVIDKWPAASTIRFDGLMSRWTTPDWWACSNASAAWMPNRATERKNLGLSKERSVERAASGLVSTSETLPEGRAAASDAAPSGPFSASELDQVYSLRERLFVLDVPPGSPLAGKSLAECRVGSALGLNVMGIRRGGHLDLAPDPAIRFAPGDQVVVQGQRDALGEVGAPKYLSLEPTRVSPRELLSTEVGFAEVVLRPTLSVGIGRSSARHRLPQPVQRSDCGPVA